MVEVGQLLLGAGRDDGGVRGQVGAVRREARVRRDQPGRREAVEVAGQARRRDGQRARVRAPEPGAGRQRVHRRRVPETPPKTYNQVPTKHFP